MTLTGPSIARGKSRQDYGTPPELLHAVRERFGKLQVDLAATPDNAVAPDYLTPVSDSLGADWTGQFAGLRCWLNPPFADIEPWARKCASQSEMGLEVLLLVPASVGSNWFREWVWRRADVYFLSPRITFVGCKDPYPKDVMLCHYRRGNLGGMGPWVWR